VFVVRSLPDRLEDIIADGIGDDLPSDEIARRVLCEVIAGMWEPSDKMLDAGKERMPPDKRPGPVWDAMVGAFCEEEGVEWARPAPDPPPAVDPGFAPASSCLTGVGDGD
jgi:hypothetical protein